MKRNLSLVSLLAIVLLVAPAYGREAGKTNKIRLYDLPQGTIADSILEFDADVARDGRIVRFVSYSKRRPGRENEFSDRFLSAYNREGHGKYVALGTSKIEGESDSIRLLDLRPRKVVIVTAAGPSGLASPPEYAFSISSAGLYGVALIDGMKRRPVKLMEWGHGGTGQRYWFTERGRSILIGSFDSQRSTPSVAELYRWDGENYLLKARGAGEGGLKAAILESGLSYETAFPEIFEAIRSSDTRAVESAASALLQIDYDSIDAIRALMRVVRAQTAKVPAAPTMPDIESVIATDQARIGAGSELSLHQHWEKISISTTEVLPFAVDLLRNRGSLEEQQSDVATGILWQMGGLAKPAVPALLEAASDPGSGPRLRENSILALGTIGEVDQKVRELITGSLDDVAPRIRWASLETVRRLGARLGIGAQRIAKLTRDLDPFVRTSAVEALVVVGPDEKFTPPRLQEMLTDSDSNVRVAALYGLAKVRPNDPKVMDILLSTLSVPDDRLARTADDILERSSDPKAQKAAHDYLNRIYGNGRPPR